MFYDNFSIDDDYIEDTADGDISDVDDIRSDIDETELLLQLCEKLHPTDIVQGLVEDQHVLE